MGAGDGKRQVTRQAIAIPGYTCRLTGTLQWIDFLWAACAAWRFGEWKSALFVYRGHRTRRQVLRWSVGH
jgi:hypothetical protein